MCDLASNTMFKLLSFFTFIYTKGRQINLSLSHLTHSLVMSYRMVREVLSILTAGGKKINIFYKYIRTMVSKSRIWGARRQRSSGLEGLLAVVSLGWRPKISGLVQVQRDGGREFQILGAATLKLRAPNDVRTNGAERRYLKERVESQARKGERK